jgi:hypothetical protein
VQAQDFTYFVGDPTYRSFTFDPSTKFIIGLSISGFNLSDTVRYFDITLSTQEFRYGRLISE